LIDPVVPESFRHRPYARERFSTIARWAAINHPFYARRVSGQRPEFPVLSRLDVQRDNDTLLNGQKSTGRTSGSTSTPVLVSWSKERSDLEKRDTANYVRWLGGPLPNVRIIALSSHEKNDHTIDVTEPIPVQVDFIRSRHAVNGACSIVTYPSNMEMLCRYVLEQGIDMSFVRRFVCLSEVYEAGHDEMARRAFPNALASCTYSCVEAGMIAARCPHRPDNYHIFANKLGVEFLDADGKP
jgi:phenylacetate-coenzyme A ligase PaaK-like adenylate-forming protein